MHRTSWVLCLFFAFVVQGCGLGGGLRAETVATSAQKPSNVAMYVAVSNGDAAARGLTEKNFRVYEDGQELDPAQIQQVVLPRDTAAVHQAVLLVDMSGALEDADKTRLAEAAGKFVTRVRKGQPVTVYAFDGAPHIRQIGSYPRGEEEVAQVPGLATYRAQDPSSTLNSAVIEALKQLDARLSRGKPIRIGTLVVLARSADLAGRIPESDMADAVDDSPHHVIAVAVESGDVPAGSIGKDGTFTAVSTSSLGLALEDAGRATDELLERYYLFAYCSPARAGTRQVRVEVTAIGDEGKEVSGSFDGEFDSNGFSSGCNSKSTPRFVAPPKPRDEDGDDEPKPSSGGAAREPEETEAIVPPPDKPGYGQ